MGLTTTATAPPRTTRAGAAVRMARLAGPAFVASVAYVDPGNVATNLTGGARYGYLLVWVVVAANLMAALVQYLSAKLGLVTGRSLPALLGERWPRPARLAFWVQAELVALATDVAEVIGGALALWLLFGLPLLAGGVLTGGASMLLLAVQRSGQGRFERVTLALLAVVAVGFVAGVLLAPPSATGVLAGLIPRLSDGGSLLLAAGILGATVMPHAVYLHSALVVDRHGPAGPRPRRLLTATRLDVTTAMLLAGTVNLAMLLLAAVSLRHAPGTDTLSGAYTALATRLGTVVAVVFAVGLLASGLASTAVGSYAGAVVMGGLLRRRIPLPLRRLLTLLPSLALLAARVDPTRALVVSQVVLSFGIPFALAPLAVLTSRRTVMGAHANRPWTVAAAVAVTTVVITLNAVLLVLTVTG